MHVHTIDTPALPATLHGVQEARLFYRTTNVASGFSNWIEVQRMGQTSKVKSLIANNQKGVLRFTFRPVNAEAIRLLVLATNDARQVGSSKTGIVRLTEIEAYGLEKKAKQVALSPEF